LGKSIIFGNQYKEKQKISFTKLQKNSIKK